ncbi:unnamed protein product [Adineta steineri]|uniref:Uncharacterized protein n=1 Tax=Adineta steineri TaxID=433720 RepID=A0A814GBV8_9BILA|nr:unnamed protein product [Adineta steineri]CAF3871544.1 unnamed protein product [Adineta steineri]
MQSVHFFILIAFLTMTFSNAFPYSSRSSYDEETLPIMPNPSHVRREEYDPYGFNSILSRYNKRSKLYDTVKDNNYSPNELNFD